MNSLRLICRKSVCCFMFFFVSANSLSAQNRETTLHNLNNLLINTVMTDLFTPPVASRIYVYPNIAFYECIRLEDPTMATLSGKLNGLANLPAPQANIKTDFFIAACVSYCYVAQSLVGTEYKISDWRMSFIDSLLLISDKSLVNASVDYGRRVADSIISWISRDNYLKSRGYSRFVLSNDPGSWQPTPLDYAPAIEPYWKTIRPMALKSASQFSPKEKLVFSKSKNSKFYKNMLEVYQIVNNLDTLKKATALYWDDNPNVAVNIGHLSYFIHKISPGGHWIMITKEACLKNNVPVTRAAQIYALTSAAIFDAFIACWYEKYKTNLIRPVTIIHRSLDKNWHPYIQTPPFPEFTSGHAVISNAAATVLTSYFGDNFKFTDHTEIPFGQGSRSFNSFYEAAYEVAMSRVYGGIHYPETARISIVQGKNVANNLLAVFNGFTKK